MKVYGLTDIGRHRDSNQDCYQIINFSDSSCAVVVCDGMGGANGGNIASEIATENIAARLKQVYRDNMSPRSIKSMIESAIIAANIAVFDKAVNEQELVGMGTTAVVAVVKDSVVYVAHVGDSRAYLMSDGEINQITRDHSIVQQMIEFGQITFDEAKTHPKRNIITRAIGVNENIEADFTQYDFTENDYLIVCTDGLSNYVTNERICDILSSNDLSTCPQLLVDCANENGGGDNITAVVAAL